VSTKPGSIHNLEKLTVKQLYKSIADLTRERDDLQRKVEALAVENMAFKEFCKRSSFDADYEAELGMDRGGFTDALNDIKTPATDAALAEIRAQGVDKFVNKISSELRSAGGGDGYHTNFYPEFADHLESKGSDFSSELRKEAGR